LAMPVGLPRAASALCRTDLFGGASVLTWGIAFGHVTVAQLLGAVAFAWLGPADLPGDRSMATLAHSTIDSPWVRTIHKANGGDYRSGSVKGF